MAEAIQTFQTRVRGLWRPRHVITDSDGKELGVLTVRRNLWGMVVAGDFRPERGEVLSFRRDPGLLRAQFSLWTDGREWLGSSLRWHVARRQIDLWTGSKPYRLVPREGLGRGWRLVATKTGEVARIRPAVLRRSCKLEVFRKVDFELLLYAYFLGSMSLMESVFPSSLEPGAPAPQKAPSPSKV